MNGLVATAAFRRSIALAASRLAPVLGLRLSPRVQGFLLDNLDRSLAETGGKKGKAERRLAYHLLQDPAAAQTGRLVLGLIVAREQSGEDALARDAFAEVSDEMLIRHALPEAARVLAESDPERAQALLREGCAAWDRIGPRLSSRRRLSPAVASAYLGFEDGFSRFASGLREPQADILKRLFAEQKRAAQKLGVSADYLSVREAARKIGVSPGARKIRIGLFDYRSPAGSSENLGDVIQTLGVVGQLSRFDFKALAAPGSLLDSMRDLFARGRKRDGEAERAVHGLVEIVPVHRDFPLTVAAEDAADGPIWLPVCGRFGVRAYPGRFDFPFPGNVRPLFMALHIAEPELLDDESLAYLKQFEPIGCRDLFTARLLRGAGVAAFFNGCVAMTLDRLRPPYEGSRAGKYDTGRRFRIFHKPSPHGDPDCLTRDFDGNLRAGLALLDRYRAAKEVRTERLSAYLPCRAMGTPVAMDLDRANSRFDGLTDLDGEAFRDVAARFEAVAQPVLAAVLEGKGEAEVYALWREVCAPAMARTDAMIAEREAKYPVPEVSLDTLGLNRIPVRSFGAERDPESDEVHLLCTFDAKLAEHFPGTFYGAWRHASRPPTVHIFGRGLTAAMFEGWAAQFEGTRFVRHDLSGFAYEGHPQLLYGYITVSAMDRLLAPELLPNVEKVVYLDMDILVRKDIAELFDIDLDDAPLAAHGVSGAGDFAKDLLMRPSGKGASARDRMEAFRNAFFSDGAAVFEGFNSGVLVMDLAKMRRERATEKTLSFVNAPCRVDDQMALNLYARARRKPLPREWNHYYPFRALVRDPAIVHFVGRVKPWASWATKGGLVGMKNAARVQWRKFLNRARDGAYHREWRENAARAQRRAEN